MKIYPKDSQLLRFILSMPLFIISMQEVLYGFEEDLTFYKILDIVVFLIALISFFSSIDKTIEINSTGIHLSNSTYLVDDNLLFRLIFGLLIIIYNPFIEFDFERITWDYINIITSLLFSIPLFIRKAKEEKVLRDQLKREYDQIDNKK